MSEEGKCTCTSATVPGVKFNALISYRRHCAFPSIIRMIYRLGHVTCYAVRLTTREAETCGPVSGEKWDSIPPPPMSLLIAMFNKQWLLDQKLFASASDSIRGPHKREKKKLLNGRVRTYILLPRRNFGSKKKKKPSSNIKRFLKPNEIYRRPLYA